MKHDFRGITTQSKVEPSAWALNEVERTRLRERMIELKKIVALIESSTWSEEAAEELKLGRVAGEEET